MDTRVSAIIEEIRALHDQSTEPDIKQWYFEGHVSVVAHYAQEIAEEIGANAEIAVLAAYFHDIARAWSVDADPALMNESLQKASELMTKQGYTQQEIDAVHIAILHHGCKGELPPTEEGKVLATADALAHLMTGFYFVLPFYGWFKFTKDFDTYTKWISDKIERDMHKKIFYPKYKELAMPRYLALKTLFGESK